MSDIEIDEGTRYYAAFIHGSVIIGTVWGLFDPSLLPMVLGLVVPVVLWLLKSSDPFVHQHGKNTFFFLIVWGLYGVLGFVLLGIALAAYDAPELKMYLMLLESDSSQVILVIIYGLQSLLKADGMLSGLLLFGYFAHLILYTTFAPVAGVRNAIKGRKSGYKLNILS